MDVATRYCWLSQSSSPWALCTFWIPLNTVLQQLLQMIPRRYPRSTLFFLPSLLGCSFFYGRMLSILFHSLKKIFFYLAINYELPMLLNILQHHFWWLHTPLLYQFCSVQFSHSVMSDSLWPHESQYTRPPCPSPTPGVYSNFVV